MWIEDDLNIVNKAKVIRGSLYIGYNADVYIGKPRDIIDLKEGIDAW